jgi:hypothetical protein
LGHCNQPHNTITLSAEPTYMDRIIGEVKEKVKLSL